MAINWRWIRVFAKTIIPDKRFLIRIVEWNPEVERIERVITEFPIDVDIIYRRWPAYERPRIEDLIFAGRKVRLFVWEIRRLATLLIDLGIFRPGRIGRRRVYYVNYTTKRVEAIIYCAYPEKRGRRGTRRFELKIRFWTESLGLVIIDESAVLETARDLAEDILKYAGFPDDFLDSADWDYGLWDTYQRDGVVVLAYDYNYGRLTICERFDITKTIRKWTPEEWELVARAGLGWTYEISERECAERIGESLRTLGPRIT